MNYRLTKNVEQLEKIANDYREQYQTSLLDRADDLDRRSELHGLAGGLSAGLAIEEGTRLFGKGEDAINRKNISQAKKKGGLLGATKALAKEFNPRGKGLKGIGKPLGLLSLIGSAAYVPKSIKSSGEDAAAAQSLRGEALMTDPQFRKMIEQSQNQNQGQTQSQPKNEVNKPKSNFAPKTTIDEKTANVAEEMLEKVAHYRGIEL